MNTSSADWVVHLRDIRRIHTELRRFAPYRDDGLVPNPAASQQAVDDAERRLGAALPPSYRQFLLRHDGWSRFFDGTDLLSAVQLGQGEHLRAARALLEASASSTLGGRRRLLPFGADAQLCSVFAFEMDSPKLEKPVVAWVGELGVRAGNFTDFLKLLAQVAAAELNSTRQTDGMNSLPNTASSAA